MIHMNLYDTHLQVFSLYNNLSNNNSNNDANQATIIVENKLLNDKFSIHPLSCISLDVLI